jgi:hypothetical protein
MALIPKGGRKCGRKRLRRGHFVLKNEDVRINPKFRNDIMLKNHF